MANQLEVLFLSLFQTLGAKSRTTLPRCRLSLVHNYVFVYLDILRNLHIAFVSSHYSYSSVTWVDRSNA